ncbi:kelch repeat and BTB domain-containing protein 13 isoform X2 [Gambusia affinis]|uniref:kelch repeat and BTB domain-containing protein 13 isoform X2 n=1 Tax=Gambusia affinis TaxID=33528 RepID=UPI001CDD6CE8|nr:kelch repeat and BTB domain-containing protein 13 isoform X2 [Gambusia affinis]
MAASSCQGHGEAAERVRVNVNGNIFSVDRTVMADNCEYFRALFQSGMRECQQEEVQLRSVGVQGFLVLLRVLQGERPMLNCDQIVESIECTAFLQVPALTKHMMNIISSENCLLMYHTAAVYGVWELSHHSALFIRDMYADLKEDAHALPSQMVEYVESVSPSSYMAVCSHSPSSELLHDVQRTICYLDEEHRKWRTLTQLPLSTSTTMAGGTFNMKDLSSVEKLRTSEGSWGFVSALPCQAASVVSAVAMNRIFICLWRGKGATEVHEYIPEDDRWVLVTTLIRQQSYGLYMVGHRDNLYMMRNGPAEDFLLCVMDCYNLTSGQWTAMSGNYCNSKGSLFTAVVRGDSVFTLSRHVTTEYTVEKTQWRRKCEMEGFGRVGSIYTFQMRLPKHTVSLRDRCLDQTSEGSFRDKHIVPTLPLQCSYDF